jgi:hypothetical protein
MTACRMYLKQVAMTDCQRDPKISVPKPDAYPQDFPHTLARWLATISAVGRCRVDEPTKPLLPSLGCLCFRRRCHHARPAAEAAAGQLLGVFLGDDVEIGSEMPCGLPISNQSTLADRITVASDERPFTTDFTRERCNTCSL